MGGTTYAGLNESSRADTEWWHTFLAKWNGISILRKPSLTSLEVQLHSDASGSWGYGAVWGSAWFQVSWHQQVPHKFVLSSIVVKELLPIILAAGIWGSQWRGCTIPVVNSGACRDKQIAHLMRCLFFMDTWWQSMYQEFQTLKPPKIISELSLLQTHRPTHTQQP